MWVPKVLPAHPLIAATLLWALGRMSGCRCLLCALCSALASDKGVWGQRLVTPTLPMEKKSGSQQEE